LTAKLQRLYNFDDLFVSSEAEHLNIDILEVGSVSIKLEIKI